MKYVYWIDDFIGGRISPRYVPLQVLRHDRIRLMCLEESVAPSVLGKEEIEVIHLYFPKIRPYCQKQDWLLAREVLKTIGEILYPLVSTHGKVVVHCGQGNDRTGLVLLLYMRDVRGMDYHSSLSQLRKKNPNALTSYGFQELSAWLFHY